MASVGPGHKLADGAFVAEGEQPAILQDRGRLGDVRYRSLNENAQVMSPVNTCRLIWDTLRRW